jgi:hypothetical protein
MHNTYYQAWTLSTDQNRVVEISFQVANHDYSWNYAYEIRKNNRYLPSNDKKSIARMNGPTNGKDDEAGFHSLVESASRRGNSLRSSVLWLLEGVIVRLYVE